MDTVYSRGGITLRLSRGECMSQSTSMKIIWALRDMAAALDERAEGDVTTKFVSQPKIKPPRRQSPVKNKTNRTDFSTKYMREYREDGKDYKKKPESMKEFNRKHQKKLENL